MTTNSYPAIGVFSERALAERAIEALNNAGFSNDQISYSGTTGNGGFLAGLKSLFTGEDESATNIVHDLSNIGVPQDQANYYADEHRAGHPVVAVSAPGREQEALSILRSIGGYDYSSRLRTNATSNYADPTNVDTSTDRTAYTNPATDQTAYADRTAYTNQATDQTAYADRTAYTNQDVNTTEDRSLRLREERLQAEKQSVQSGEVRLHKDVIEEQKNIDVPVTHEEVYIERHDLAGDRASDLPVGQDETIRVPVSEERVNVTKSTVDTGEVSVGKRAVTENQRVSDTVRREEARVEKDGDTPVRDSIDDVRNRSVDRNDATSL